jgi:hypothetical protein
MDNLLRSTARSVSSAGVEALRIDAIGYVHGARQCPKRFEIPMHDWADERDPVGPPQPVARQSSGWRSTAAHASSGFTIGDEPICCVYH